MKIIIYTLLLLFNIYDCNSQINITYDSIIKLIENYSYKDEINSRKNKEIYQVIYNLEKTICSDSVYKKFKDEEIKEISFLFLKKRAVEMKKYGDDINYISNMRLWPGDIVSFSINTVINIDQSHSLSINDFIDRYTDFVCVNELLNYKNKSGKKIEKEFKKYFQSTQCH